MVEIDTGNKWVDIILRGISTVAGFAAAALIGGSFDSTISNTSGIKRVALETGRLGIETVAVYEVSSKMYEELKEFADEYNEHATAFNVGRETIGQSSNDNVIYYEDGE